MTDDESDKDLIQAQKDRMARLAAQLPPAELEPGTEVVATRDPGEYVLKIGEQYYVQLRDGRRVEKSLPEISKLVTVPYWGWNLRKPGTTYPVNSWDPDYEMQDADDDDDEAY